MTTGRIGRVTALCFVVACLAACAVSAPARHFTLESRTPAAAGPPTAGVLEPALTLVVGPIELPPYLDRPQLSVRQANGELALREFDRWAEPLEAGFTRVLATELAGLLQPMRVVQFPFPGRVPADFRLVGRVDRFEVDQAGVAVLEIQWGLIDGQGVLIMAPRRQRLVHAGTAGEAADLVRSLSITIGDLARTVADAMPAQPPPAARSGRD